MTKIINNKGKIKIEEKGNEDLKLVKIADNIFKEKRGYVVKMPRKGSPVVCCMSGGGDAVSTIFILMNEFGYKVFPFFINRGQSCLKWERGAIHYYDKIFRKKFPNLYNETLEIKVATPAREYKDNLREVKKKFYGVEHSAHVSYPVRNSIIFLTGAEYALSLRNKDTKIDTVFVAHVSSDTSYHCSLTWQRLLNLEACHVLNDWKFQFISLPIEPELGNYFDKDVFVKYCHEKGFDLSYTRSCIKPGKIHCGTCPCCWDRRRCFLEAGIEDKTRYLKPYPEKSGGYY